MNNKILIIIIAVLLTGSGITAFNNKAAVQKFCENVVTEAGRYIAVFGPPTPEGLENG